MNQGTRPFGPVLAVLTTPLPELPTVDLFRHTLEAHILKHGLAQSVPISLVVSAPSAVVPGTGTGRPGHLIFVGEAPVRAGGRVGSPLTVVINAPERFVCSAYPNRAFKIVNETDVIWPRR